MLKRLSEAEIGILDLLAEGLSTKEIAERLCISENTVKSHTSHIYLKMGIDKNTCAATKRLKATLIYFGFIKKRGCVTKRETIAYKNKIIEKMKNGFKEIIKICKEPADNYPVVQIQTRIAKEIKKCLKSE